MNKKEMTLKDCLYQKISKEDSDFYAIKIANYLDLCLNHDPSYKEIKLIDYASNLFHQHAGLKKPLDKDYILTDFIKSNKFIINSHTVNEDLFKISIMDLAINFNENNINDNIDIKFNIYKEFVFLTEISKYNRELVRDIVRKLDFRKMDRRFLRVLSLYAAIYCLELRMKMEEETNIEVIEDLDARIDYLFESFDDFTNFTPSWLR